MSQIQVHEGSTMRATRAEVAGGRPLPRNDEIRMCAAPDCETRLSAYNRDMRCWQHEPVHRYTLTVHSSDPSPHAA
jgi:hypothetical protein